MFEPGDVAIFVGPDPGRWGLSGLTLGASYVVVRVVEKLWYDALYLAGNPGHWNAYSSLGFRKAKPHELEPDETADRVLEPA